MVCKTCKLLVAGRCTHLNLPVGNLDPACAEYTGPMYEGRYRMDDDLNHGKVTDDDVEEDEDWDFNDDDDTMSDDDPPEWDGEDDDDDWVDDDDEED